MATAPDFSNDPMAKGFFAPTRFDAEIRDCEVIGEIPSDLAGTFYRVGPNRAYPQRFPDDVPFNGDGMASYFRIANGHCDYLQKFIKTQRFVAEHKAKRALLGKYRNRFTNDPAAGDVSLGTANTHIFHHHGKMLALKEDSPPVALDPHTLETTDNYYTFGGQLESLTYSAHPKIDYKTGELVGYGYEAKGDATTDVNVVSFDRAGRKSWEAWVKAPYVCMMHDCAITENYVLIPTTGYTTSMERLKAGAVHWAYDESLPIYLIVVPRRGDAKDARIFKAPHRCIIHTAAAYEENGTLVMDSEVSDGNTFPFFFGLDGSPFDPIKAQSTIRRWTVKLDGSDDRVTEEVIFPQVHCGLPRVDDRYIPGRYRYGYATEMAAADAAYNIVSTTGMGQDTNVFARYDIDSREVKWGSIGAGLSMGEPLFAPRKQDCPEGDGYLMSVANNFAEGRSELIIADAQRLEQGPVARVILPFRSYFQVHGSWVPKWELDFPG
jgi:carotenoid cleavage dioxygenase